ncbi:hypothetical protein SAMN05192543_101129 [Paraburkholderia megapolitana]|uniref:Uncharacterized protein n=1 Tax=Paraburkholderia megapolitana TaxID=420953 RepID=A0A1I3D6B4_9BURK|nr:hypothetical protein SAMN05192543_101129 [Paraburkholderia megapolitana]
MVCPADAADAAHAAGQVFSSFRRLGLAAAVKSVS